MLHNTGSYGPSEAPVSHSAPVNLPQMNNHLNMSQNGNNFNKMPQPGLQTPSGHFTLPEYNPYSHSPLNMSSHFGHLSNYQPLSFSQQYMAQNSTSMSPMAWQNGMLPMNLNMPHDNVDYRAYPSSYDKRYTETSLSDYREPNIRKVPLNIPQIQPKLPSKPPDILNHVPSDDLSQFSEHNVDLSSKPPERTPLDSMRRQNIENTVRLIENILINTTSKNKNPSTDWNTESKEPMPCMSDDNKIMDENVTKNSNESLINSRTVVNSNESNDETTEDRDNVNEEVASEPKDDDSYREDSNESNDDSADEDYMVSDDEISNEEDYEQQERDQTQNKVDGKKQKILDEEIESTENENQNENLNNQSPPLKTVEVIIKRENDEVVDSKVEINVDANCIDNNYYQPFLRDPNGVQRDDVDCQIIDNEVSVEEAMAAVKNVSEPSGYFECPHCTLLFKHPKRFLIHTKWHSFGMTYEKRMELAKRREQRKTERREAKVLERMHSNDVTDKPVEGRVFRCSDCDKVFSSKSSLKNHRKREHAARVRECRICGTTVLGWNALRTHIATHNSRADSDGHPWQCTDCPKRFKYSHSLAKHRDTHKEKTHACEDCPKKFGSQYLLKLHRKTHERMQKGTTYRCTYCGKGFYECYSLQVHERTHRNERPFHCETCDASFGTNSSLKRHIKVSHNSAKPFECPVCHRCFSKEAIRDKHQQRVHAKPEDFKYPCTECDSKYLKLKDLQKHVNKIHPKNKRRKRPRKCSDSDSD